MVRTSVVHRLKVNDVSLSSTLQVGDLVEFKPYSKALAIQREESIYLGNEGNFEAYELFSKPIPQPKVYEDVDMEILNRDPYIQVGNVRVIAAAASSLIQVGSTQRMEAEARVKHIRQLKHE
jgi:spore germination protein PE